MDLESEHSALESVEDNEVVSEGAVSNVNDDNVNINGSYLDETNKLGGSGNYDANVIPVYNYELGLQSEELLAKKFSNGGSPPMKKGYGLKKWKRIKRDFLKDIGPIVDSSKILKRGLFGSVNPTTQSHLSSADVRQNSEASVGSGNVVKSIGFVDGFATRSSSSDSRFDVGLAFSADTDSENSEDRSSKSSNAASAPKSRYELPAASGYVRERNRMNNLSGKIVGNPTQRFQQGKSWAESSKKFRVGKIKIEKENSHSSMESDSRSFNFVFLQGAFAVTSNGRQSGQSMNDDGEISDDTHACEQQFGEDAQTIYTEENVGVAEDIWDAKEETIENHQPSTDQDPLCESLLTLLFVQEVLEKEVQKLGQAGKDAVSQHDNSFKGSSAPADSSFTDQEIHGLSASRSLEIQVLSLTQNVQHLETKLEEMSAMLNAKELRVAELEATLNSSNPLKEESVSTIELHPEQRREMETELAGLFGQKIEAEVEYLALTGSIENLIAGGGGRVTLTEEQEALAKEQSEMLNKLGEAETKAVVLKKQAEELEKYCGDTLGTELDLKMQNRVCKVTSCFVIQVILLVLVFWHFVLQLSYSGVIVPT